MAKNRFSKVFILDAVFVTCEAVLTEVLFLTRNSPPVLNALSGMMNNGLLSLEPVLSESPEKVFELLVKYQDSGASLADICLVHLFNKRAEHIFTTDSDFLIYRDSNGNPLELISPYAN